MNIRLELNVPYTGKEFFEGVINEQPAKSPNSKQRQKNLASEICSYYTIGRGRGMKYIITEIYSQRKIELNGKYAENMKTVLIYLLQNNNRNIVAPKSILMTNCGFVNNKYLDAKRYNKKTAEDNQVMLSSTVLFLENVDNLIGQAVKRNIMYLVDASYIISRIKKRCRFTIKETNLDKNGNVIYINGKPDIQTRNMYMLMNEEQEEFTSGAIRYALNECGFNTQKDVYKAGKKEKEIFYNKVYENIQNRLVNDFTKSVIESNDNWIHNNDKIPEIKFDYFYEVYDIKANEYIYDFKITKEEFTNALNSINEISKQSILDSINNEKTLPKKENDILKLNERYKEDNTLTRFNEDVEILVHRLIDINLI
ncbi:hypothetical protein CHL78_000850 [Romboutsia weinsteinii]|uniref:Uncharacterized protein n=1 Tax=Romboutsia weinsteinii TaxID=2020949 RepID=A0A371JAF1_9FIRM|nr:hypothetical protein [Romboutsia weinsteinii]RDY29750.1 hypothetical protein CHL78_000850 [Romboutsia weinsteinii]